ncbi:MAG: serine hydrolase [Flavobacteriaceae bacterium]|nr:serine hydrolase [Flavobacteriaceae bacterium]
MNKKTSTIKSSLFILALLVCFASFGQESYQYRKPKTLTDGWKTNNLLSRSIDTSRFYKLFTQLKGGKHKIHSVLLIQKGELILEEYFGDYSINSQHDLRSVSKSIQSILLGIAIDKGFIDDINDPISKYIKNPSPQKNRDSRKEKITIKHLITMSSGLDCNDWDKGSKGQEDKVYRKKNWLHYFLNLPLINEPGTISNYCTVGQILATEIISRTSGMPIDKFAEKYLFTPLDITNLSWGHTSKKKVLTSGKRLYMTPRDMAKIGLLILHKGIWGEHQVVSEKWIEESTSPKTKITGLDYGYLWWNIPATVNGKTVISKLATGNGGQYIFIYPELDIVAVFTGGAYNSQEDKLPFAIVNNVFLHAFLSKK